MASAASSTRSSATTRSESEGHERHAYPALIDGRQVEGRDYFETVNPATQEVLAEVAAGGADEINAAVAAAKEAFPAWAALPAAERAKMMVRLGDLIAKHVPEISEIETRDCGR